MFTAIRNGLDEMWEAIGGSVVFIGFLVLLFTETFGRIAQHFGVPPGWAFVINWSVGPLILLLPIMAVVLVIRRVAPARRP